MKEDMTVNASAGRTAKFTAASTKEEAKENWKSGRLQ